MSRTPPGPRGDERIDLYDPYDLQRFVQAQDAVIDRVRDELRVGRKRSHWMWFVFPQMAGLGHSAMAQRYAVSSIGEARAYLAHPVLGPRLRECAQLVLNVNERTINEILGAPDDMKFCSSMTLFLAAAPSEEVFRDCLGKYFADQRDPVTLSRLRES